MERFKIEVNKKGHLVKRESFDLEFKQSFQYGDSLHFYIRSLVGMANNRGGQIVFGITDSPREPVGLQNDKFENRWGQMKLKALYSSLLISAFSL
jgi:predicted HTH transcriptional regulator